MTLTFPSFGLFNLIALLRGPAGSQRKARPEPVPEHDLARADRAFVRELMARNPEAIQSEHGMLMLMALYPMHF